MDGVLNVTGASRLFTQDKDLVEYDVDKNNNIDPAEFEMPFGKKKGTKIKDLSSGYLNWIVEKMEAKNKKGRKVKEMAKKYKEQQQNNSSKKSKNKKEKITDRKKEVVKIIKNNEGIENRDVTDYLKAREVDTVDDLSDEDYQDLLDLLNDMKRTDEDVADEAIEDFNEEDFDTPF